MNTTSTTHPTFVTLPLETRRWLDSNTVSEFINGLNTRFGFQDARELVITYLIARLLSGELRPQDFVNMLALKLELSDSAAQTIAQMIEQEIFHPVEDVLLTELGLDVSVLHVGAGPAARYETAKRNESLPIEPAITPVIIPVIKEPVLSAAQKPEPAVPSPTLLREERVDVPPPPQMPKPTFSIKIPLGPKKYIAPPIKATIETPPAFIKPNIQIPIPIPPPKILHVRAATLTPPTVKKVVHYSRFFTPFNREA